MGMGPGEDTLEEIPQGVLEPDIMGDIIEAETGEEPVHLQLVVPRFRFQHELPPEERAAYQKVRRAGESRPHLRGGSGQGEASSSSDHQTPPIHVLDRDWASHYQQSPEFQENWLATQDSTGEISWPHGVHIREGKMYWAGKLCVPEDLVQELTAAYHHLWGHI